MSSALEGIKARTEGHTPGPWRFDSDLWLESAACGVAGYVMAPGPYDHDEVQNFDVQKADAELIAAAPKMLAALKAVEEIMRKLDDIQEHDNVSVNASAHGVACVVRAAIEEELA